MNFLLQRWISVTAFLVSSVVGALWLLARAPVVTANRASCAVLRKHVQAAPELSLSDTPPSLEEEVAFVPFNSPHTDACFEYDSDAARAWSRGRPLEALQWIETAPIGSARNAALESVCLELVEFDAEAAVALADHYAPDGADLLENLVQQWSERDCSRAVTFASGKPPGELRDRLFSRIAFTGAKSDPVAAARVVTEQIAPGRFQVEAAISVLHQWDMQDRAAARAWALQFPFGAVRDRALQEVGMPATGTASSSQPI